MMLDKVQLEVLNHRFTGIVEEMGYVIHRTGFTVFVKETWDFDSALVTPEGEIFCYPRSVGVTNMLGIDVGPTIRAIGEVRPGDVILTNDPLTTEGMCTHLPDLMALKPVFHDGELLCFAWCFLHCSDVGGLVPGSIAPSAYDRHQEGFIIPPTKLYRERVLNEEFLKLFLSNTRTPENNWGDVKALVTCLATAERRVHELADQYGSGTLRDGMNELLDYGERRARQIISDIPDGTYDFADYLDGQGVSAYQLRIKVSVTIDGSDIVADFSGTDPQVRGAFNLPSFGKANQWLVLGIVNFLRTTDSSLPNNRGILRPLTVRTQEGTLLNASPVAATGIRHASGYRAKETILGSLAQATGGAIPASDAAGATIVLMSWLDARTGRYRSSVLQPLIGGSGGRSTKDGIDGVNFAGGSLRNAPTESIELEAPVLVRHYRLIDDVAPGEFRGGAGIDFEFEVLEPNTTITARGMDRLYFQPWGREGGHPGVVARAVLNPGSPQAEIIGRIDVLHPAEGDVLGITSPGGGGYGDPAKRNPELVARDVRNGFITSEEAASEYGVIVHNGQVDDERTSAVRAERPATAHTAFSFGPARAAYEEQLPPALQDIVVEAVRRLPIASRHAARDRIYDSVLKAEIGTGGQFDPDALTSLLEELLGPVRGDERALELAASGVSQSETGAASA
jgi:N-methylhydantoinase B